MGRGVLFFFGLFWWSVWLLGGGKGAGAIFGKGGTGGQLLPQYLCKKILLKAFDIAHKV